LQPVVLLTGQAAGLLAAEAIKKKISPANINVRQIQQTLLKSKCYLMPYIDVSIEDPAWEAIQIVGLEGLIKGIGKSQGWANKTFFYPDSLMQSTEFLEGLKKMLPKSDFSFPVTEQYISFASLEKLVENLKREFPDLVNSKLTNESIAQVYRNYRLPEKKSNAALTRKETAVYLQLLFNFFEGRQVTIQGDFK
jgi:hypothetical protein